MRLPDPAGAEADAVHDTGEMILTAFSSQIRTFGQLGQQGPAVTLGQKVRI